MFNYINILISILALVYFDESWALAKYTGRNMFCSYKDIDASPWTVHYRAYIKYDRDFDTHSIPVNITCSLHAGRSACKSLLRYDLLDQISSSADVPVLRNLNESVPRDKRHHYVTKKVLENELTIGRVYFHHDSGLINVDFIITQFSDTLKFRGAGLALMASVFDIARKCHFDSIELDSVKSSEDFYRNLGMSEIARNRFRGGVHHLAFALKQRASLKFLSASLR